MNEINLQTYICKNNIFFYQEYIDIYISSNFDKYKIDKDHIYNTTYKLYNFFNNLINNKTVKIDSINNCINSKSILRIYYKNTNKKCILKKDFRLNGKNSELIKYGLYVFEIYEDIELLTFIIDHNYDINVFGDDNNLLLEIFSKCKNVYKVLDIIKKIVIKTDNINLINKDNKNCLIYCIIYNYFEIFEYILKKKNVRELLESNSCNIFYTCMLFKRYNFLKKAIQFVDINIENFLGENLLMMAIKFRNIEFIDIFINNIDINHTNIFGENAILYCFINKYYDILNYIIEKKHNDINYDIISTLIEYDYPNKYNDILFILEKGGNVNKKNEFTGNIPLHDSIILNDSYITELLIQYNSKINEKNNDGYTPLMLAVVMNDINIVKLLLSKNCDIYMYNNKNLNALMISYIFNNNLIFFDLIKKYNNIDDCLICLEKKVNNKNIDLLLLWFYKVIEIISANLIKYYYFKYKAKIQQKILFKLIDDKFLNMYTIRFLNHKHIHLKKHISDKIKHIKDEINYIF